VVLIDLLMPVMDGLEATRRIRDAGLPTILAFHDDLLSAPAPEAGACAHLVKGCSVDLLLQMVAQAGCRAAERRTQDRAPGGFGRSGVFA
jgi:CheY-like chemotaxis protein